MIGNAYAQVKGLSDEQLLKERQMPSGTMPMYLVITEMEKRAAIRKEQQQPAPQGNVADQTTDAFRKEIEESSRQQMAESGIGAIHSPTLTAASGGLVAFDQGGPVRHFAKGDPVEEEATSTAGRLVSDTGRYASDALEGIKNFFDQTKRAEEYKKNQEQVNLARDINRAKPGFFESLTPSQTAAREATVKDLQGQQSAGKNIPSQTPERKQANLDNQSQGYTTNEQGEPVQISDQINNLSQLSEPPVAAAAPAAPVRAARPAAKPTPSSQDMLRADLDKLGLGPKTAEQTAIDEANTRRRIEEKEAFLEKKFPDPNAEYSKDVAAKRAILKDRKDSDFWTTILGAGLKGAAEAKSTPGIAGVIQSLSGTGANAVEGIQKLAGEREKRDDLLMQAQQQMAQANQARKLGFLDRANAYEAASQAAATAAKTQGILYAQMLNAAGMDDKRLVLLQQQVAAAEKQAAKPTALAETLAAYGDKGKRDILQGIEYGKSLDSFMAKLPAAYKAASGMDMESNPEKYQAFVNDMVKDYRIKFQAGLGGVINIPPKTPG